MQKIEHLFRKEYAKLISLLTQQFGAGHIENIEDAVQDALLKAMQVWSFSGQPEKPTAWLFRTAKNRLVDILRRQNKLFDELVDAGFMRKDVAERIRAANPDYVPFERVLDDEALEDYLGIPTKKVVQVSNPADKRIEGSERDIYSPIESIIANTYKYTAAVEKNKVAQSVIGLKEVMPEIGFRQVSEAGPGTIPVWVDGVKQHVEVGKDIAEGLRWAIVAEED